MRILIRFVILPILLVFFLGLTTANTVALDVKGVLKEATPEYVVVDGRSYPVTKETVISEMDYPKQELPYDHKGLTSGWRVKLLLEKGVVKKILIEVPK